MADHVDEDLMEMEEEFDDVDLDLGLRMKFDLDSGADLSVLVFSPQEQRYIYEHVLTMREDGPHSRVKLYSKFALAVDYNCGVMGDELRMSMYVIFPEKLGKVSYVGVDISPGAKTYLEFDYERKGMEFVMGKFRCNGREINLMEQLAGSVIQPVEFPFPIPDRLVLDYGKIRFPFAVKWPSLDGGVEVRELWVPMDIRNKGVAL